MAGSEAQPGTEPRLFAEVRLRNARELLDALTPHHGFDLWQRPDTNWMFRGQAEGVWPLVASAQRPGAFEPFLRSIGRTGTTSTEDRRHVELAVVMEFAGLAAERGYVIPDDTPQLRDFDKPLTALPPHGERFPPTHLRSIFALAQHYRIPTRLLDWTFNPLVGAYFAAKEVAERLHARTPARSESDGQMAVWALEHSFLVNHCSRWDPGAIPITAPASSNPNLSAQRGAFTLVRFQTGRQPETDIPALDALFTDATNVERAIRKGANTALQFLYKLLIPHTEGPALLYLLDRFGVNAASVFPGHASVTESMRERQFHAVTRPLLFDKPATGK